MRPLGTLAALLFLAAPPIAQTAGTPAAPPDLKPVVALIAKGQLARGKTS